MAADLLRNYEPEIEKVVLIPSDSGRYEIEVNGTLLFSKKATGRHAQPGEILRLVRDYLKERTQ